MRLLTLTVVLTAFLLAAYLAHDPRKYQTSKLERLFKKVLSDNLNEEVDFPVGLAHQRSDVSWENVRGNSKDHFVFTALTGTIFQWRLTQGNILKNRLMSFVSLH